jgi:hypothetical protein
MQLEAKVERIMHATAEALAEYNASMPLRGSARSFFTNIRLVMSLPQNLLDDLQTLDQNAAATATAVSSASDAQTALASAQTTVTTAQTALTAAQASQAAQLAKVKSDLDTLYGQST